MKHHFVQPAYDWDVVGHSTISVIVVQLIVVGSGDFQCCCNSPRAASEEVVCLPEPSLRINVRPSTTVNQDGLKLDGWS
jgi:hypothetical protein